MGYELFLDLSKVNLNTVLENLKYDDMLVKDGKIYIWTDNLNKKDLLKALKKVGIEEVYCRELAECECETRKDFVGTWLHDHFVEQQIDKYQSENQELLSQMVDNINKANALIDERVKNNQ